MTIRIDRNQVFDSDGNLVSEELIEVDITEEENASIIDQAITAALAHLDDLIAAPALPTVPDGTLTTAQLSEIVRALRNHSQANRAGAQQIAKVLKQTIRLVRGDFDGID
jgi:tellurite resistance protein